MISNLGSTTSALKAFNKKLNTSADNIANVNTNRFKRTQATMTEGENGGVRVELNKDNRPGMPVEEIRDGRSVETESSNVDLAEEIPETITTRHGYRANLKAIKAQDDMLGSLLDTIG